MAGPIIYLLGMNLILLAVKIMCGLLGYNLGTSIIGTMTEQIEKVSRIASMIGVTVIAGLAVSFVKITTPNQGQKVDHRQAGLHDHRAGHPAVCAGHRGVKRQF